MGMLNLFLSYVEFHVWGMEQMEEEDGDFCNTQPLLVTLPMVDKWGSHECQCGCNV